MQICLGRIKEFVDDSFFALHGWRWVAYIGPGGCIGLCEKGEKPEKTVVLCNSFGLLWTLLL